MKLRIIAENEISGSKTVVRDAADALGELIQYIYTLDDQSMERRTLDAFLTNPTPEIWHKSKWLADSAIQKGEADEGKLRGLRDLTSPVVTAALYDVDSKNTKGTPFSPVSLTTKNQKDLKAALGPQGYVSNLSELGEVSSSDRADVLKQTAENSDDLDKAAERDLPSSVRRIKKF